MQSVIETATAKKTRAELKGRKLIRCPHCRVLFMDIDKNDKVELFRIPVHKRKSVKCDKIKPCDFCGGTVGYNLIKSAEKK